MIKFINTKYLDEFWRHQMSLCNREPIKWILKGTLKRSHDHSGKKVNILEWEPQRNEWCDKNPLRFLWDMRVLSDFRNSTETILFCDGLIEIINTATIYLIFTPCQHKNNGSIGSCKTIQPEMSSIWLSCIPTSEVGEMCAY